MENAFSRAADDDARFTSEERRYDRTRLEIIGVGESSQISPFCARYPAHRRLHSRT